MVSFNFCGNVTLCSVYFNNTDWYIDSNSAAYSKTWSFSLVPGLNEITLNESVVYKKGSMLQLSFDKEINIYSHSHDILLNYEFDYPISKWNENGFKIQPSLGTFCVRALTRRYYFATKTSFSVQFVDNGTFSLLFYMYDQMSSKFYVRNNYTVQVNPPGKYLYG